MRMDFRRFLSPNELQKETLCYSDGMGFEARPDFKIDRASFHNYLIMHTITGRLWCCQNSKKIAVDTGESILLDLHRPHLYFFEKKTPTKIAWLHINGAPATQLIRCIEQNHPLPLLTDTEEIYPQMLSLFACSDVPQPDIFEQSEQCYALLLRLLKEACQKTQKHLETPRQEEFKKVVWHIISHNLHRSISIDELAQAASLSKYHFIRTFHKTFGLSPMQFILKEKIRQTKYQLAYTADTVLNIAESLGFATPSYFSKVFKSSTGFSPSAYRRYGYLSEFENQ